MSTKQAKVTADLTCAFREAAKDLAKRNDWDSLATIAAEYTLLAKDADDQAAFLEGMYTFEEAIAMSDKIIL